MKPTATEFRNFFDLSLEPLCLANTAGYFEALNAAFTETLGWTIDELEARPFIEFVHPEDAKATQAQLADLSAGKDRIRFESRFATRDGGWRRLSWTCRPDPNTGLLYAAARDVTRERELNDELRLARDHAHAASRAKSRFLASTSHELRTPLNAIIGYSELMAEDAALEGNDTAASDLGRIRHAAHHLLALINEVLDLSKIEAGRMRANYETVGIASVVDNVLTTARPLASKSGLDLTVDVRVDGAIRTDPLRLDQVLLNLVSNAIKFTDEGSVHMTVDAEDRDGKAGTHFVVRDTGVGLTTKQLEAIFEPFYQAHSERTSTYGGTGLGLTVTRELISLMDGRINIESARGVGTSVSVWLPG